MKKKNMAERFTEWKYLGNELPNGNNEIVFS